MVKKILPNIYELYKTKPFSESTAAIEKPNDSYDYSKSISRNLRTDRLSDKIKHDSHTEIVRDINKTTMVIR